MIQTEKKRTACKAEQIHKMVLACRYLGISTLKEIRFEENDKRIQNFSLRKIFSWNHATFWLLITFSSPIYFREHQIGSGGGGVRSQQGTAAQTSVQQSTAHSQPMRSLTTGKKV